MKLSNDLYKIKNDISNLKDRLLDYKDKISEEFNQYDTSVGTSSEYIQNRMESLKVLYGQVENLIDILTEFEEEASTI